MLMIQLCTATYCLWLKLKLAWWNKWIHNNIINPGNAYLDIFEALISKVSDAHEDLHFRSLLKAQHSGSYSEYQTAKILISFEVWGELQVWVELQSIKHKSAVSLSVLHAAGKYSPWPAWMYQQENPKNCWSRPGHCLFSLLLRFVQDANSPDL